MEHSGGDVFSVATYQLTAKDGSQCAIGTNLHGPLYLVAERFEFGSDRIVCTARPRSAI